MPVICHPELAIRHRQSVRCEMNKFDDMMLLGMKGAVFGNRVAGIVAMNFVTFDSFGNRMCNLELINMIQQYCAYSFGHFWTLCRIGKIQSNREPYYINFGEGLSCLTFKNYLVSCVCNTWSYFLEPGNPVQQKSHLRWLETSMIWATT